jgi:hypothetical protein
MSNYLNFEIGIRSGLPMARKLQGTGTYQADCNCQSFAWRYSGRRRVADTKGRAI